MSIRMSVRPGRPRDARIDDLVLAATRSLLAEKGFAEATIQAIARRAGVGPSAIYRRWPSRIELIETAIFPGLDGLAVEPTGDLRIDLQRYVDAYTSAFATPAARAAIPALLSTYQSDPAAHGRLPLRVGQSVRREFHAMLRAAHSDPVDTSIDPDSVLDQLIGSVLYRTFVLPFTGRSGSDDTAELLVRALRPGAVA